MEGCRISTYLCGILLFSISPEFGIIVFSDGSLPENRRDGEKGWIGIRCFWWMMRKK